MLFPLFHRFEDLTIRLGAYYLYRHQGDCDHVLMFTDMRMLHDNDERSLAAYPLLTFKIKSRRKKCGVCDLHLAAYVTYNDKLAAHSPFYFCRLCYKPLHYDKDGTLLYDDFQVYPYVEYMD